MTGGRQGAFAAVDIGASSGRVMVGVVGPGELQLTEAHRFANIPVEVDGTLHWDILSLYRGVIEGLRAAGGMAGELTSIGIDTWAVDYGLLDPTGALLGNPVHYRDRRTDGWIDRTLALVPAADLYARTGLRVMPINTVFQLMSAAGSPQLQAARSLLLVPDLLAYWLTGVRRTEVTNASTTGLLDVHSRGWAADLMQTLGITPGLFGDLQQPGDVTGQLQERVRTATGLQDTLPVVAVGSHDTASAVVGVPADGERFAYISCGTWSLVGVELDQPILTEASRLADFTNEAGVDGKVRYLRNVMGLWLLQEAMRTWHEAGSRPELVALLQEAARVPAFSALVDANDMSFLPPGDMPARIAAACRRSGQPPPTSPAATVRCILESLALAYRHAVAEAADLSGGPVEVVHLVGGGARNELLCQLTADACGRSVVAGPVEAAALGNALVQARAAGAVGGDLADLRRLLRHTQDLRRYEPSGNERSWAAAARRIAAQANGERTGT
ncbi:MAG: rhamnulokinase [Actinomycetota bacterium]|nr:rhamnulokinase [Actinomycetota bacterium]